MQNHRVSDVKGQGMTRREFMWLSSMTAAGFVVGCATNPVTGKNQFMLVSEGQEIQMDKQHSPHQVSADYGICQDTGLNNYVKQVGRKQVPLTHRPGMPYSFNVVNATYVNAYAFPGGTIAATRGIMLKMENEAQLASLIGHELGHVNARHTAQQMSKSQVAGVLMSGVSAYLGTTKYAKYGQITQQLGMLGAGMLLASYSRENEREADRLGNEYMVKAGYNTDGFVDLMEMLKNLSNHKSNAVEMLFSTHPMSNERYNTAVRDANGKYRATKSKSLGRDRYKDHTAKLRRMRKSIEAMQKGEAAMAQNKFKNAESSFKQALRTNSNDYTGMLLMTKCLLAQKKNREAENFAARAIRRYPTEAQAYHLSGYAKIQNRRFDSAYQAFGKYDKLLPGNPNMVFFKGYSLEGMNQKKSSASHYSKYLQLSQQGDMAKHASQRLKEWGYIK